MMNNQEAQVHAACPKCNKRFSFTMGQMLGGEPILCPECREPYDTAEARKMLSELKVDVSKMFGGGLE